MVPHDEVHRWRWWEKVARSRAIPSALQLASGMWLTAALTRGAAMELETLHLFSVRAEKLVRFSFLNVCVCARVSVWVCAMLASCRTCDVFIH